MEKVLNYLKEYGGGLIDDYGLKCIDSFLDYFQTNDGHYLEPEDIYNLTEDEIRHYFDSAHYICTQGGSLLLNLFGLTHDPTEGCDDLYINNFTLNDIISTEDKVYHFLLETTKETNF